jgi:uncharacterized protein DUF4404
MERNELIDKLAQLHADLSKTKEVDPATLERLRELTGDIDRLLDENDAEVTEDQAEPITSGLKNLLLKFEAEHPQFSAAVGKVADALAAIGI